MATKLRTADNLKQVSETVTNFLRSPNPSSRALMTDVIKPLSEIGEVAVVGGLVRDLAFYGPSERPISDIDLVVRGSPSALAAFAERAGAVQNRFGGYGLKTAAFKADFWSLSSTWARREGHVSIKNPADLVRATFFDWDAIVYSVKSGKIDAINGYIGRLQRRVLDLNLEPNPSIEGNLVRALRRVMMWDVRTGPLLRTFIETWLYRHDWDELVFCEKAAFHTSYLSRFSSARQYHDDVLNNSEFSGVGRDDFRQTTFDVVRHLPYQSQIPTTPDFITRYHTILPKVARMRSDTPDLFED